MKWKPGFKTWFHIQLVPLHCGLAGGVRRALVPHGGAEYKLNAVDPQRLKAPGFNS
jgi:hypothetical protein